MNKHIILIGLVLSLVLFSCDNNPNTYQSLKDINELQLSEFSLTKTVTIRDEFDEDKTKENSSIFSFVEEMAHTIEKKIKKGNRVGVYGISQVYKVSIDLSQLTPKDVIIHDNNIKISIPDVEIERLGNDLTPKIYHERVSAWRSDISLSEREDMMREATRKLKKEFLETEDSMFVNIKDEARLKAKNWLETILKSWGYNQIEINIR